MKKITSTNNDLIKEIYKCRNKESYRRKRGVVLVEGERQINFALKSLNLINYFFSSKLDDKPDLEEGGKKIIELQEKVFEKISFKNNPDGHLALFDVKNKELKDIKLSKNPLILVLDSVEKPGNLGAVARTAVAAKVDAIILTNPEVDPFNSKVISSSTGHSLNIDIVKSDREDVLKYLKSKKIKIFATSLKSSNNYLKVNFKTSAALVFGSEDKGLSQEWLKTCDQKIKIPMLEKIDSLNISVSAAIIIYEVLRQKKLIDF